jgi:hypothetical protein
MTQTENFFSKGHFTGAKATAHNHMQLSLPSSRHWRHRKAKPKRAVDLLGRRLGGLRWRPLMPSSITVVRRGLAGGDDVVFAAPMWAQKSREGFGLFVLLLRWRLAEVLLDFTPNTGALGAAVSDIGSSSVLFHWSWSVCLVLVVADLAVQLLVLPASWGGTTARKKIEL